MLGIFLRHRVVDIITGLFQATRPIANTNNTKLHKKHSHTHKHIYAVSKRKRKKLNTMHKCVASLSPPMKVNENRIFVFFIVNSKQQVFVSLAYSKQSTAKHK